MSIVRQTPTNAISPIFERQTRTVVTAQSGTTPLTHRDVNYLRANAATSHREYDVIGADLPVAIVAQSPSNALDISEWPTIKRQPGINDYVTATFENSRGTTVPWRFDFRTSVGGTQNLGATSAVADSYFAYSYPIVKAIADAMTTNSMWDGSGNRAQTSVIPHQAFTGQVWNGGWGIPGVANGGRRFMAITPRHLFGPGHYQYYPGEVLYFKDVNNVVIPRTVLRVINVHSETHAAGLDARDISVTLLSSDLPGSITILPVVGDWGRGIISYDANTVTVCAQAWGFTLFNNDGHLVPFCADEMEDTVIGRYPVAWEGITFDNYLCRGIIGGGSFNSMENWPLSSGKFAHVVRGGDSGSPGVIPVAGGWAFCGNVSGNQNSTPGIYNQLIALIDARAVAAGEMVSPTGHTVTVAPDPTL